MNYELKNLYNKALKLQASNDALLTNLESAKESIDLVKKRAEQLDELQVIVQEASKRTQDKIKSRFETIVQSCLDVVFPSSYNFHFDFVPKRGKTECEIYLEKDGVKYEPMDSNGGGVVDVISIALRVACLTLTSYDKVLLLDEPFGHLRGASREKLGEVLNALSDKLGLQIVMVGDVGGSSVKADKEFLVTKNNGISQVTEVDLSER